MAVMERDGSTAITQRVMVWFWTFLVFGFVGWVYEVWIVWFEMHLGFANRGFLWGPCLPIYGVGGLLILLVTAKVRKHPILCFLVVCMFTTGVELLASYLMEWWMGGFLWDYRNTGYGPTFEGRIALRSSLQFGIMGMAAVYVVYPLIKRMVEKVRAKLPKGYLMITLMIWAAFMVDLIYHVIHGSNAKW